MSAYIGLIIAFIYLIAMIAIGIVAMRWIKSGADFLVSGREVGWFVIASSLAACQVAGTTVAGYPGTAYNNGWGAVWGAWGWSISILIFGLLLARFIRRTGAVTLVEWFEASFGTETRVVVAIATIIALLFGGMAQFVGSANIVAGWLRMDYTTAVLIIGIATLIYMYTGGNWATVVTDAYQFIICAVALYVLLPAFLLIKFGGLSFLTSGPNPVPAQMLDFPFGTIKKADLLLNSVPGLIAMNSGFILANSYYWVKAASARSEKVAVNSAIIAALFILPFGIVSALAGMYVRAAVPGIKVTDQVFGVLLQNMHPLLAVIMIMAILAATQSTANNIVMGNATVIARDIICRIWPNADVVKVSRWATVAVSLISIAMAIWFKKGALYGLALMSTFIVPALPPLLGTLICPKWVKKEGVLLGVGAAIVVGLYWHFGTNLWATKMHTMYVTFLVSAVVMIVVSALVAVTGPWWKTKREVQYLELTLRG